MPKFSLYWLPMMGAVTYLLTSAFNILMPVLRLLQQGDVQFHYFVELFMMAFTNAITPAIIIFLLLIPILNFFKLNRVTLKNSLAIIGLVAALKIIDMLLVRWIIEIIFAFEGDYSFVHKVIMLSVRFATLGLFIVPLILLFHFFSQDLDRYDKAPPQGQKRWLVANLLTIIGIFNYALWLLYPLATFFHANYSLLNELNIAIWLNVPVTLTLLLMIFSKKIYLSQIVLGPTFIISLILAVLTSISALLGEWLIMLADHASIGAFIFMLIIVPIAAMIILSITTILLTRHHLNKAPSTAAPTYFY